MTQQSTLNENTRINYANYLAKIKSLDNNDPDLINKINRAQYDHGISSDRNFVDNRISRFNCRNGICDDKQNRPYFGVVPFFRKEHFVDRIDSVFENFEKQFHGMHNNDFNLLEKEFDPQLKNKENAYSKYTSSFTSYDNTGNKKSKTITGVEKYIDGKRHVSKKSTTINGDDITEVQYFPDGRRVEMKHKDQQNNVKKLH